MTMTSTLVRKILFSMKITFLPPAEMHCQKLGPWGSPENMILLNITTIVLIIPLKYILRRENASPNQYFRR